MDDALMPRDDSEGGLDAWLDRVATAAPVIEAEAAEGDRIRHLTDRAMAALHEQGLLRLLLSRDIGGSEVPTRA